MVETNFEYDVAVVGTGYGGLICSLNLKRGGVKKVCLIDKRGKVGGTCLFEGCIPSKCLLNASQQYYEAKHVAQMYDWKCQHTDVDFQLMQKKKDELLDLMAKNNMKRILDLGIDFFEGYGKLTGKHEIEIDNNGQKKKITAANIVINTGAESAPLPGNSIPIDKKRVITSDQALSLPGLPKSMIVVGGGFIGLELGSHFNKLGTDVTIVEFLPRVLPMLDAELGDKIKPILEKQGLKQLVSTKVVGGTVKEDKILVNIEEAKGGNPRTLEAEYVLIATGRRALTRGIGLEELGIEMDKLGRCVINSKMQTNIPHIYAIGDVSNKGPAMAHKAEDEALALVDQFLGKTTHLNYDNIPIVVYTHPEVAQCGKTEEDLVREKIPYKKGIQPFTGNPRAKAIFETDGFIKFLIAEDNTILGIQMIGPQVGEQVMEAVMCIEYKTKVNLVGRISHAHPSFGEAFKDAAINAMKSTDILNKQ